MAVWKAWFSSATSSIFSCEIFLANCELATSLLDRHVVRSPGVHVSVQKVITMSCKISKPSLSCLSHHRGVSEKRINKFVEGDNFQAAHVQMHLCTCPAKAGIDVASIDHESMSVRNTMRWRPLGPCSSTVLSPSSVRLHVHSDLGWTAYSGSIAPALSTDSVTRTCSLISLISILDLWKGCARRLR